MEAVVLAGGLGTRLASVVKDVPKPMAPVCGRPFLEYLLDDLIRQGVTHVILAVCHKKEVIIEHFGTRRDLFYAGALSGFLPGRVQHGKRLFSEAAARA